MTPIPFEQRFTATVDETIAATGIGRSKLYELIRDGEIDTTSEGRRRLIVVRSIVDRLKRGSSKAAA